MNPLLLSSDFEMPRVKVLTATQKSNFVKKILKDYGSWLVCNLKIATEQGGNPATGLPPPVDWIIPHGKVGSQLELELELETTLNVDFRAYECKFVNWWESNDE